MSQMLMLGGLSLASSPTLCLAILVLASQSSTFPHRPCTRPSYHTRVASHPQQCRRIQPFGDNQTQQSILHNQVILNAVQVPFPEKPKISEDAKVRPATAPAIV